MPAPPLYDLAAFDFATPLFTIDEIRVVNPQRFEMEQLTAIVHVDPECHGVVGYKDVRPDEYWCRGHMPGFPLMPGVLQCEAAPSWPGSTRRNTVCSAAASSGSAGSTMSGSAAPSGRVTGWTSRPGR